MINILEAVMIQFPFVLLLILSLLLVVLTFRLRQITGEDSIIHLMAIFLFASVLFFSLLAAYLNFDNLDAQYWFFTLGIFAFWAVLLEMGVFYLSVFINPNRVLPSVRLYIPAILGAAATISSIKVLENFGNNWENYHLTTIWELVIDIVAITLFIVLQGILIRELYRSQESVKSNPSNLTFVINVRQIITSGTLAVIYVFVSVVLWFYVKTKGVVAGNSVALEFSLLIQEFELVDWLVYLNIPILLVLFVFITLKMRKLIQIAKDIDIGLIYNIIT